VSAGAKLGAAAATGVAGAWLLGRGFASGARQGWPEGKQRAYDRWGHLTVAPAPDDANDQRNLAGLGSCVFIAHPEQTVPGKRMCRADTAAGQAFCDQHSAAQLPAARPSVTPITRTTTGPNLMAINTVTGGEVLTMSQLLAELNAIKQEASTELEDAQADAKRASEDARRIDVMVASLRSRDMDSQTIAEVGALGESASARLAAADQRAAAADKRLAQVSEAINGLYARHNALAEAHAAAPHAADKEFYVG
jgi:hypothetical protein